MVTLRWWRSCSTEKPTSTRRPRKADIHAANQDGATSLMVSAQKGYFDVVQLLLERQADIHAKTKNEITGLFFATVSGHVDVVRLLLKYKARVDAANAMGWTPLHASANLIPADKAKPVATLLLDAKAAVDATDCEGNTALMLSAESGRLDMVQLLLESNADIQAASKVPCPIIQICTSRFKNRIIGIAPGASSASYNPHQHTLHSLIVAFFPSKSGSGS